MSYASILLIVFAILLTGCAQQPIKQAGEYRLQAMQHLYAQTNWQFEGRLAVAAEHESFSASINWQRRQASDVIELVGPLGQGRVLITVTAMHVVVDDGDKRSVYLESADRVFAKYFGIAIPVQAFRYWLLGVVEPEQDYTEVEKGFIQHQWRVKYRQMQMHGDELLPRKINIEKEHTKIKLVIDQWKVS